MIPGQPPGAGERDTAPDPSTQVQTLLLPAGIQTAVQAFFPGEVLADTYAIEEVLGVGGMGIVYSARDIQLNREVAIKIAHADGTVHSLREEAQALAAIRHPSMVMVYAFGRHRGLDYLVMERLHGMTLEQHLQQRARGGCPFTVAEALMVLEGLAEGLHAVHNAGISHRDIKPANIMLAPAGRIVLMDFGLFCPETHLNLTLAGSPEYMAPEAILDAVPRGRGHLVDIYAFGVVAFQVLTGRPPYTGLLTSEVLSRHLHDPVPDLSREVRDLPPELAKLITESLAKDPLARPPSIELPLWQIRGLRARMHDPPVHAQPGYPVLIVDDDSDTREMLEQVTRRAIPDAEIRWAASGEEALARVQKRAPRLMLIDLCLPGMSGFELCMYMQGAGLSERSHVVVVSAAATDADVELLQKLGIGRCLRKSPDLAETLQHHMVELRQLG